MTSSQAFYVSPVSACPAVSCTNACTNQVPGLRFVSASITARSGPQRVREIRKTGHIVQGRPSLAVFWADISELYVPVRRCPAAWQQY